MSKIFNDTSSHAGNKKHSIAVADVGKIKVGVISPVCEWREKTSFQRNSEPRSQVSVCLYCILV